jgi:hypothetical protein
MYGGTVGRYRRAYGDGRIFLDSLCLHGLPGTGICRVGRVSDAAGWTRWIHIIPIRVLQGAGGVSVDRYFDIQLKKLIDQRNNFRK